MLMLMKCNALKEAKHLRCYTQARAGLRHDMMWCGVCLILQLGLVNGVIK
jgi:hypothetical protein